MIRATDVTTFSNSGVTSCQLLFPENSRSERVTITRVTFLLAPGILRIATNAPNKSGLHFVGTAAFSWEME